MRVLDSGMIFDGAAAAENERNCAFTSVSRLADGTLLVAFRNATGRDTPDGRLRIMRSRDQGRTWETLVQGLTAVVDGVKGNLYSGYFTELTGRELLGAFLWVDRSDPARSFVNPDTTGLLPMKNLIGRSRDGGAHWSGFSMVDLSPHRGASCTGPVMLLTGGILALPFETWKDYDDVKPAYQSANLRLSHDGGQSWRQQSTVAADPEQRLCYWDQRIARHPTTGLLVAMFWTHDRATVRDLDNHIAWGQPNGRDWTAPAPTGLRGQHCEPIPVGGDRLLAVYVHRADPPGLRAVLSDDFGRTWQRDSEIVFYESREGAEVGASGLASENEYWQDMMAWRFGHPRGVLLLDGSVFVAFYVGNTDYSSVRWVRLGDW
jgi:hypothetical protein